jgi:hypothetical protein
VELLGRFLGDRVDARDLSTMTFSELSVGQRLRHPEFPGFVAEVREKSDARVTLIILDCFPPATHGYVSAYASEFDERFELIPLVVVKRLT